MTFTEIISFHDNGQKDEEIIYENFAKVQTLFWYETGEKHITLNYVYGVLDNGVLFNKNGQKNSEGKYKNDKKSCIFMEHSQNTQNK